MKLIAGTSYQAYAALELLFCPDISKGGAAQPRASSGSAELFFVEKIKDAVRQVGPGKNNNQLLKQLY